MKPEVTCEEFKKSITVEQMRKSDAYTIERFVPSKTLMYRAAYGVYEQIDWRGKRIAIVCGSGNNGGDGYALAGILAEKGIVSHIYRVSERFSEDGLFYYKRAMAGGAVDFLFEESTCFEGYDVIVDCMLGTGFKGTPRGNIEKAIERINGSGAYVVSVDINSGLDGDTGEAVLAVSSNLTVSIGFYKRGMFLAEGPRLIGDLVNADIGIVLCD